MIDVMINTDIASFTDLFSPKPCVITVSIGINEIGSMAIKVFKKFWRNKSCISQKES